MVFMSSALSVFLQIFLVNFEPSALMVQANYTRRGGIDINPVRVLNHALPAVTRQVRQ